jgi:hypothetical protein
MTYFHIVAQQYVPTMTPGHSGCLVPRENAAGRQTDMDGPMRCSSLTLEREEHIKGKRFRNLKNSLRKF